MLVRKELTYLLETQVKTEYYPEVAALIKRLTGCQSNSHHAARSS